MRIRLDVCIGCLIAGILITIIGLYAALGGIPGVKWEIFDWEIPPLEWGWPFAIFGIILLIIGVSITYLYNKNK